MSTGRPSTGGYTYDDAWNIKEMGSDAFSYDSRSRLVFSRVYSGGVPYELNYQYDQFGNLNPSGVNGANNRLWAGVYDDRGNLTSYGGQRYDYDGLSRQTALNGGYERYLYDGAGERVARVTAPGKGTKLYTISPCRVLDTRFSPPAVQSPRVVQVTGNCGVSLDASGIVGNLTAVPPPSPAFGFLNLYATGTNPGTSLLNFNANQVRANNFQLGLSGNGQASLVASSTVDAILDVVGFFAFGAPTWTVTLRDEANRLATEYTVPPVGGGSISRSKNYFYLGNLLVATRNSVGGYTYWASDHLGTPRASTGTNPETHKYQPFGTEITAFGSQPIKFAAMERDASSGNDFDHARYQSSLLGRFLSPDLVSGIPDEPQSWNRYSYTLNNPLKYVDPTGLISVTVSACPTLQICAEEELTVTAKDPLKEAHEALLDQARAEMILEDLREQRQNAAFDREVERILNHPAMALGMGGMKRIGPRVSGGRLLPFKATLGARVDQTIRNARSGLKQYPQDGTLFVNKERLLPLKPKGYYSEWTIAPTQPGSRGLERLVLGKSGEIYYSPSHYKSFVRIE